MGLDKKEQEHQWLEVVRTHVSNFPAGPACISESPDFLVMSPKGLIGVEITRVHRQPSSHISRAQESERRKLADHACSLYEKTSPIKLEVKVYIGGQTAFSNRNIAGYALTLVDLVLANMPPENSWKMVENPFDNPRAFPYEINAINIARFSVLTRNFWFVPSGGVVQGNFIPELEEVIDAKGELLGKYESACIAHWLIVVAENNSPSTFLDPSATTLEHSYHSSFDRIFLLEAFRQKVSELTVIPATP